MQLRMISPEYKPGLSEPSSIIDQTKYTSGSILLIRQSTSATRKKPVTREVAPGSSRARNSRNGNPHLDETSGCMALLVVGKPFSRPV
jgi:hypothetical protein